MATAPSRATGSLTIGFGLVAVPVQVFSGTQERGIKRSRFSPAGNPIKLRNVDGGTGEEVAYEDLVSKLQVSDGTWVELSDEEIQEAASEVGGSAEVLAFLPSSLLCTYEQIGLCQVRPAPAGNRKPPSPAVVKAYCLLMDAMESSKTFALTSYTLRGKSHVGAITPDGFLRQIAFSDEIREALPMPSVKITADERKVAAQLISALQATEAPELVDHGAERVKAYAESKVGKKVSPKKATVAEPIDMLAALQRSVKASAKKHRQLEKVS